MSIYKPKKLIHGYSLGAKFGGRQFVAIPTTKNRPVTVQFEGGTMVVNGQVPEYSHTFKDKFGRGDYRLEYFEWKANETFSNNNS